MTHPLVDPDRGPRWHTALAFLLYLAFVVYGSLVPFELRPMDWDRAIAGFRDIPYLSLGLVSRADWISNIVLYVPLAFLGCAALLGTDRGGWRAALGVPIVGAFCLAVAFGVEFVQQWFAPRTVSLNDLIAESIGTLIGLALWLFGRRRAAWLWRSIAAGGRPSVLAALIAYAIVYLTLSLFPFDFVLSAQELQVRLASQNQGWLVAPSCEGAIRCGAGLGLDMLAILPLGVLAVLLWPALNLRSLFVAGLLAGLVLELVQLFIASGTVQGLSVPLRGIGLALGGLLGNRLRLLGPRPVARAVTIAAPILALPYLTGLVLVSRWFAAPALSPPTALARLDEVRWLPFYYQYYTTESVAVASVLAQLALYAPLGLFAWGLRARRATGPFGVRWLPWLTAALALTLSLAVELGKLFFPPAHPDPTNLLAALTGALLAFALASWLERVLCGGESIAAARLDDRERLEPGPAADPHPSRRVSAVEMGPQTAAESRAVPSAIPAFASPGTESPAAWPAPRPIRIALGLLAGIPLVAGTLDLPLLWPVAAGLLALYGIFLWIYPLAWLAVLPALLPALDLSPLTGRLPLDPFDLCVLASLAVGYARLWGQRPLPWPNRIFPLAVFLLWLSWLLASALGLWPLVQSHWPPPDSSHSLTETWAVGKGMLWALLLVPLLRRVPADRLGQARRIFAGGVLAGLALVALSVLWERHLFVGIADLERDFRVTGTFASMHTGGAYIEAFLAFAFPFLGVAILRARTWAGRLAGILLAALASYAIAVTFSRGGWAGLMAGIAVLLIGSLTRRDRPTGGPATWVAAGLLVAAVALAMVPVLTGSFAQARLAQSLQDLKIRLGHWGHAVALMTPGARSVLIGEGFGQYPLAYLLQPDRRPPGTYAVVTEGTDRFLRLGAGETVYLDQRVGVEPGQTYRLSARVRLPAGAASLKVPLCEKALLYSFQCQWATLAPDAQGEWQDLSADIDSGQVGLGGNWPHPPVALSLHNAGPAGPVDVDNVSLKTREGRELIANGAFSEGARRWLFVTDQDLAWHIHEQWVELFFAQGVLGVLALALLLAATGRSLWRVWHTADPVAIGLAAGIGGILTVGLLGSVLDTARLAMLVYFAALLPAGLFPGKDRRRRGRTARHRTRSTSGAQALG